MKKICSLIFLLVVVHNNTKAQYRNYRNNPVNVDTITREIIEPIGFNKNRVFVGSGINLGFGSTTVGSTFNIGLTPEIGYSLTKWLDLGVSFNLNYFSNSERDFVGATYKQKSFNYGAGTFLRLYPIEDFFIQVLPEYNYINRRINYNSPVDIRIKSEAFSVLAGIGYGKRIIGQSNFYTAIMVDLARNADSPYLLNSFDGSGNETLTAVPVIRAGFTIYLKPKSQR